MTDNAELQRRQSESNEAHIERLRSVLRSRRAEAQAELEAKHHLEDTISAMSASGAPKMSLSELHRLRTQVCRRLGEARGQVELAEAHLVIALNR